MSAAQPQKADKPMNSRWNLIARYCAALLTIFALTGCIDVIVLPDDGADDGNTTTNPGETDTTGDDEAETAEETETGDPLPDMPAEETGDSPLNCGPSFSQVECDGEACEARWTGTEAWSAVVAADVVASWSPVADDTLFACASPDPSVDGCGEVDSSGHVACWSWEGECARVSVPLCVIEASASPTDVWPDWMPCDAGQPIGATALCTDAFCWTLDDPTSAIHPRC